MVMGGSSWTEVHMLGTYTASRGTSTRFASTSTSYFFFAPDFFLDTRERLRERLRERRLDRRRERLREPFLAPDFFLHPPDFFTPYLQRRLDPRERRLDPRLRLRERRRERLRLRLRERRRERLRLRLRERRRERLRLRLREPFLAPGFFLHPPDFFTPYLQRRLDPRERRLERRRLGRRERLRLRLRERRLERRRLRLRLRERRLERRRLRLRDPFLDPGFFLHPPDFLTPYLQRLLRETRRELLRERDLLFGIFIIRKIK